uniref:Peptidase M12A domain-containing protein n=1 Tax=Romanomermis culicivorax TaxID=13658 RepID=A0A915HH68_ROMCU
GQQSHNNNKISPVTNNYGDLDILDEEGLFQGDIRLTVDQAQRMYDNLAKQAKDQRQIIKQALDQWSSVTCLRFAYQPILMGNKNGLIFTPYMGCTSNVGRYPYDEPQEIGISFDPKLSCMK